MMNDTPEMRTAAFTQASRRKQQMIDNGITVEDYFTKNDDGELALNEDAVDAKVIELCEAKVAGTEEAASKYAARQQWYVEDLCAFALMSAKQRYEWGKAQAFPDVATDDELLASLAD